MIRSRSEWCERASEGNGCCVVWRITFYLLPPAAAAAGCLATAPHHEESLGRVVQQNAVAASRLRATRRQNRRTPATFLIDR